ncbi:DoxX-like family protein [Aquimarina amphilecti]|uniref:DoxX-like family protein n=1 Tax=Aquimarina amphilecti TaxID=1038014 RepID=A0A1H7G657_AQUAM|nr:DoxX family protein [Aquimarina amphilecti]SEK33619.1 DoxX-like family protein [Aquimarina amphilecti]
MPFQKIIERTLRYFVAFFIFVYGAAKPLQFSNNNGFPDKLVSELTGMELMWSFFGYTQTIPIIIGILQVTGALLLLSQRTKIIGALLLLPIMTNIVLFDIFYQVNTGATINAIVFLIILIVLLFFEQNKMTQIFKILTLKKTKDPKKNLLFVTSATLAAMLFFAYTFLQR